MTRVLALVPYPLGWAPGQRFRIEQWARRFRHEGIEIVFSPFLRPAARDVVFQPGRVAAKALAVLHGYRRRAGDLRAARQYDVAYIYREAGFLGGGWIERQFAQRVPVVFDFDDAIYLKAASPNNAWLARLKRPGKVAGACSAATHVTVGNDTLRAWALQWNRRVTVVPSTIETDHYRPGPCEAPGVPIIGWTGSQTTAPHLLTIGAALRRLRKDFCFVLRVVGAEVDLPGLDVQQVPWRAETEPEDLMPCSVGLMPLPDDEWSRGKCGMKALQFMALGIPPIVSPVGVNATIVRHGVNGCHAATEDEWVERLRRLLDDDEWRRRLGSAARATVEQEYSAAGHVPRMAQVLRDAAASRTRVAAGEAG